MKVGLETGICQVYITACFTHRLSFRPSFLPPSLSLCLSLSLSLSLSLTLCVSLTQTHTHTHTHRFLPKNFITKGSHMHWNTAGKQGSCSSILNFPCLCAILIVCHFCLQSRLCALQIKPMETWKVEHCPHFHQGIAYRALPWLPRACVTYLIKVALVSPMHCPIWALD